MKNNLVKQSGFTIIELMIVMIVMSLFAAPFAYQHIMKFEEDRIEIAVAEINDLFQSAQNYAAEQDSEWPSEADNCASAITTLNAENYLQGFSLRSPFGTNLSTSCTTGDGKRFMVSIDAVSAGNAEVLNSYLPSSTVSGNFVTVSVPMPAAIPALEHLLPRDGSRPMTGDLDLDDNNILNANQIETETVLLNSIVTKDSACASNGLVARDNIGNLLSCVSGQWKGPEGAPQGMVAHFNRSTCPDGWVASNGANGTRDVRGTFIRALDIGRGIDTGRTLGSYQAENAPHLNDYQIRRGNIGTLAWGSTGTYGLPTNGAYTAWQATGEGGAGGDRWQIRMRLKGGETRPKNVALLACQKQP